MIIGICGYNSTGSSAVLDLLKEYSDNYIIEEELSFLFLPDGVSSLDYAVSGSDMYFCGDVGISRFITFSDNFLSRFNQNCVKTNHEFISQIIQAQWFGNSCFDATRKKNFNGVLEHTEANNRQMYLAHNVKDFNLIAQLYVKKILSDIGYSGNGNCIVNQLFSAANPAHTMKYVKGAKAIVVNRDPRDVFILGRKKERLRCYPHTNVEDYVKYCNCFIKNSIMDHSGNTLYIQFEDMIYHYSETVKTIENFCKLKIHMIPKTYFDPEVSKKNVQLKYRFPEFRNEMRYIEETLPDMLYDFPEAPVTKGDFF